MIEKKDLESKFSEVRSAVDATTSNVKNAGIAGAVGLVILLLVIFLLGRRKGKKSGGAVLEVYKL